MEVEEFQRWIHGSVFQPVVVVIGTARCSEIVKKNTGLSLSELFAPFCGQERPVPVSYNCLDKSMAIPNPIFRFVEAQNCEVVDAEKLQTDINNVLQRNAPRIDEPVQCPPYPWFDAWFDRVASSLQWSEGECLDQPFSVIMMTSSCDGDPLPIFEQLSHESNMPSLCRRGFLEMNVSKVHVLVHDNSEPDAPDKTAVAAHYQSMQTTFSPASCYALNLNRPDAGPPGPPPSPPERYNPSIYALRSKNGQEVGNICVNLTSKDVEELEGLAADVIAQGAFPWMETKIKEMDAHITAHRKGIGNRFKRMWGTKDAAASSKAGYNLSTMEGQLRAAGDLAFHMRDYVLALSYYRTAITDFKSVNQMKSVGGCYEMSGICSFLAGQARSEWFRFMESAYEHYQKCGEGYWATRCTVICARMDRARGKEVALRCMRLSNDFPELPARSALFLEQASRHYIEDGCKRKAIFHLVLAGHTFNKCSLKRYALRCYSGVLPYHKDGNWIHIKDHLHFTMGRQAFGLGLLDESMSHFVTLLNSFSSPRRAHVSTNIDREATYIRECLYVINTCREKAAGKSIGSIELPYLDAEPRLMFSDDGLGAEGSGVAPVQSRLCRSNTDSISTRDVVVEPWERLGERCVAGSLEESDINALRSREESSMIQNLSSETSGATRKREQLRDVGIGKFIVVELVLRNPFQNPIEIMDARLCATIDGEEVPKEDLVSIEKISIPGRQAMNIRFQVLAAREGVLRIGSVQWMFFAQTPCTVPLDTPPYRPLELCVRRNIPSCRACIEGLPDDQILWAGETRWCYLHIKNDGDVAINGFKISWFPGDFVIMSAGSGDDVQSSREFSSDKSLAPGEEVRFDVLLWPCVNVMKSVKRLLRFCICGGVAENSRVWCTTEAVFIVNPTLSLKVTRYPSSAHPAQEFLSCMVTNAGATKSEFQLNNLWYDGVSSDKVEVPIDADQVVAPGSRLHLLHHIPEARTSSSSDEASYVPELRHLQQVFSGAKHLPAGSSDVEPKHDSRVAVGQKGCIILDWACPSAGRRGFVHMPGVPFLDSPSAAQTMTFPLRLQIVHEPNNIWSPNFTQTVEFIITNVSEKPEPLSFDVHADNTAAMHGGNLMERDAPTMSSGFMWIGCTQTRINALLPGQRTTVKFTALFPSAGVFNLNRVKFFLLAAGATSSSNAYTFPMESLVYVLKKNAQDSHAINLSDVEMAV